MICRACHLVRADRVDARLLMSAYGGAKKKESIQLFHSRYKVQSQSNKLKFLDRGREKLSDLTHFLKSLKK